MVRKWDEEVLLVHRHLTPAQKAAARAELARLAQVARRRERRTQWASAALLVGIQAAIFVAWWAPWR